MLLQLRRENLLSHMTQDARVTVREYIKKHKGSACFRAEKRTFRGQRRVFHGHVTITAETKPFIVEHAEALRPTVVMAELALCTFLCFAGLPQQDASGWIAADLGADEFVRIEHIAEYLEKQAVLWKRPRHVTECEGFTGRVPKGLKASQLK